MCTQEYINEIIKSEGNRYLVCFPPKGMLRNLIIARYNRKANRVFISTEEGLAPVKTVSQRYKLFKKAKRCVKCGARGEVLILERVPQKGRSATFHFNLYCIKNGKLVLMTKDHIIPKSKGGGNVMRNYQTMCYQCNQQKADRIEIY